MIKSKVKLYDENRHFIGETRYEIDETVTVLLFGDEFFARHPDHPNSFALVNGLRLKNGDVSW